MLDIPLFQASDAGIGCGIQAKDGTLSVLTLVPTGSAALTGKIAVGDVIVSIDGTPVGGDK